MNILTFDVEEWFHLLGFEDTENEEQWKTFEVRIHENVDRVLRILDDTDTKATFFIIGWIARAYPEVVKKIASKYEIGSHTMSHQLVWQQTRDEFRQDVDSSIKLLQDLTGQPIKAFRAPGFSLRESEGWAFETLHELGITTDSSVFPAVHAHGGMPSFPRSAPSIIQYQGIEIKEFPISTTKILGRDTAFCGGGYFRLFPYWLIKRWIGRDPEYVLSYIHPRDLDSGQPVLSHLPLHRKFKSYVGLKGAEKKLRRMLTDYKFTDMRTAAQAIDWAKTPKISIY